MAGTGRRPCRFTRPAARNEIRRLKSRSLLDQCWPGGAIPGTHSAAAQWMGERGPVPWNAPLCPMVKRLAPFAVLVAVALFAASAEAALLARIVSQVAVDQPSLALLVLPWGQKWGLLLAFCAAACQLMRPAAGRQALIHRIGLILLVCALSLTLCLFAGGLAAFMQKLKLSTISISLPNAAKQASAEAMLAMAEWTGLPLAGFMTLLLLRPWKPGLGSNTSAASAQRSSSCP